MTPDKGKKNTSIVRSAQKIYSKYRRATATTQYWSLGLVSPLLSRVAQKADTLFKKPVPGLATVPRFWAIHRTQTRLFCLTPRRKEKQRYLEAQYVGRINLKLHDFRTSSHQIEEES